MDADKAHGELARQEQHKNARSYIQQIQEESPHTTAVVRTPSSYLKSHPSKTRKTNETQQEKQVRNPE